MSRKHRKSFVCPSILCIKSKLDADIIRFSANIDEHITFEDFQERLSEKHELGPEMTDFVILHMDATDGDLLPITNDTNLARALATAKSILRIFLQRKNEENDYFNRSGIMKSKNMITSFLGSTNSKSKQMVISSPQDFRQVSSIIDVDILPITYRRVKLVKHGSDKPLGFFIKDNGFRGNGKQTRVFISRVVPGGLAASTGLLAVNDEILEVNGIEVAEKTLDQITDMMIANSSNLIITVKPADQQIDTLTPRRDSLSRRSKFSSCSEVSTRSTRTGSEEDYDEIIDLMNMTTAQDEFDESISQLNSQVDEEILCHQESSNF